MSIGMVDAGSGGGGGGSLDADDDPWESESGSSSSSSSDHTTDDSDGGVWSDTDAREEEQFRGVQSGTIDDEDTAAPGNGDVTTHQRELLSGQERSGGSTAESSEDADRFVNDTTANINNIPGSTNYDVTADDAASGGFGASPGTPGYSAVADPETDTQRDATGSETIETGDSNDLTQDVADEVDETWNDVEETADNVTDDVSDAASNAADAASDAASNAADEATDLVDLTAKQKLALGVALVGAAGIVFRPYASAGASAAEVAT